MKMNILENIRQELRNQAEEGFRLSNQKFFREKITCYGVRTPLVRKIAQKYFSQIKPLGKQEIFRLSEELLKSDYNEEATIAIQWTGKLSSQFTSSDFGIFENWLQKYLNNWAKIDDFCLHVIHPLITQHPHLIPKVKSWSLSPNKWVRRAAAVSFITTSKASYITTHNLEDIFEVATTLLQDPEDLVQKGYGWLLKATSIHRQAEVFDFIMKHKAQMPRTALRYAIEKMPPKLRTQALAKN
jgi:3-methyladenine DNA glycosylase AlkD